MLEQKEKHLICVRRERNIILVPQNLQTIVSGVCVKTTQMGVGSYLQIFKIV